MTGPKVHFLDASATAKAFRKMGLRETEARHAPELCWWERALAWLDQVWL